MQWEYKTLKMATHTTFATGKFDEAAFDQALNEMGEQGWELVTVFPLSQTRWGVIAAFKRQIARQAPRRKMSSALLEPALLTPAVRKDRSKPVEAGLAIGDLTSPLL